jgi:hypothetical protein
MGSSSGVLSISLVKCSQTTDFLAIFLVLFFLGNGGRPPRIGIELVDLSFSNSLDSQSSSTRLIKLSIEDDR